MLTENNCSASEANHVISTRAGRIGEELLIVATLHSLIDCQLLCFVRPLRKEASRRNE